MPTGTTGATGAPLADHRSLTRDQRRKARGRQRGVRSFDREQLWSRMRGDSRLVFVRFELIVSRFFLRNLGFKLDKNLHEPVGQFLAAIAQGPPLIVRVHRR